MDNQKPGHTTVESLKLQLALRRCPCADHRRRSRRPSPSATGACRCATSDPGAPRPIPDAHIRDCRLHWVPSTRPYNTTKQSVHGGHRARGPTIASLRLCMRHPVRLADTRRRDRARRPWAPTRAWHTAHVQRSGTGRRRKGVGRGHPGRTVRIRRDTMWRAGQRPRTTPPRRSRRRQS